MIDLSSYEDLNAVEEGRAEGPREKEITDYKYIYIIHTCLFFSSGGLETKKKKNVCYSVVVLRLY